MPKQTKAFTPEEKAEYRKKQQEDISALVKRIDEGVKNVFQSERFKDYLKFCSSFTNYSAGNTLLISMQNPQATFVASFNKWQQLGRNVDKGQKGIQILAPVSIKTGGTLVGEREVTDDLGIKQYNDDGTVKTETVEEPIKQLAFKKVYVFDVSQTSGKEIPTPMDELNGEIDSERKKAMLSGVQKAVDIPVEFGNISTNTKGYFDAKNQRIVINEGMSDIQTLKTAFHEAAHKFLHDKTQNSPTSKLSRDEREVQAEATAFIVANKYGIDTSEYSFPYIASWSEGKELTALKSYLSEIQSAAREICKGIDNELLKLQKRSLSNEELISDTELTNVQKAEMLIERKEENGFAIDKQKKDEIIKMAVENQEMKEIISAIDNSAKKNISENIAPKISENNIFDNKPDINEPEIPVDDGYVPPEPDDNIDYPQANLYEPYEPPEYPADYYVNEPEPTEQYIPPEPVSHQPMPQPSDVSGNPSETEEKKSKSSSIIGNTPYNQLGNKSDLKYFHATPEMTDKIAAQLNSEGIKFSGIKRSAGTTFTVNKRDAENYSKAVATVNAEAAIDSRKNEFTPKDPNIIGNTAYAKLENGKKFGFTVKNAELLTKQLEAARIKFAGYKGNDRTIIAVSEKDVPKLKGIYAKVNESVKRSECREFIAENINKAFENRAVKEFVNALENKFGIDNAMYVVGKNIAKNPNKYPEQLINASRQFKYPKSDSIKPLENIQPSLIGALFSDLAMRKSEIDKQNEPPKPTLNSYFNGKHLLPVSKKILSEDDNGFPITKQKNTAINEYYVQGYGWLDNEDYEKSKKEYPNPAAFDKLVTKVNVNYVSDTGRTGKADIDYSEYRAFSEITYSKENEKAYAAAKQKLEESRKKSDYSENPTEYYAVSRISENRYNIITMGTDGTPDIVKQGLSKEQAAQAMKDIYYRKDSECINCEIISQSALQEMCNQHYLDEVKAAKEREGENYTEHDVSFTNIKLSVLPNPNKDASDDLSHFVQVYVKDGDKYKAAGVAMVGTYDECKAFTDKAKAAEKMPEPVCKIYQLKGGEENHDVRYAGSEELKKLGLRPDFTRYEQVYEMPLANLPKCNTVSEQLEVLFSKFNADKPVDFRGQSLSVSDVVEINKQPYFVDSIGFKKMTNFLPEQTIESRQKEFLDNYQERVNSVKSRAELYAIADEAKKLGIDCEVEIEPEQSLEQKPKRKQSLPNKHMKRG